jgi:protein SCO1/2
MKDGTQSYLPPLGEVDRRLVAPRRRGLLSAISVALALAACAKPSAPAADIGGPFRLVDQNGTSVDQSILKGKWTAVYFGYTFCPDVCPTTLTALAQAQARLGPKARDFRVVFITVDPARDSPSQLKTYLASPAFPTGTEGLTGSPDQIAKVARAYRVYYRKDGGGAGYSVDHTSVVYLMDPRGAFSRPIDFTAPPAAMAAEISQAMAQG